jgi:hypothetical protein
MVLEMKIRPEAVTRVERFLVTDRQTTSFHSRSTHINFNGTVGIKIEKRS